MTDRRTFLTKSGLALGALIVGDEVLDALDRLTHRKVFALGGLQSAYPKFEVLGGSVTMYGMGKPVQWNFSARFDAKRGLVVTQHHTQYDLVGPKA